MYHSHVLRLKPYIAIGSQLPITTFQSQHLCLHRLLNQQAQYIIPSSHHQGTTVAPSGTSHLWHITSWWTYSQQPVLRKTLQHIQRMIDYLMINYLRQQYEVAKLYLIKRNLIQLYSRSGEQIMTSIQHKRYSYTPTRIAFLWNFLDSINATMAISDAWIPRPVHYGDSYMMDQTM